VGTPNMVGSLRTDGLTLGLSGTVSPSNPVAAAGSAAMDPAATDPAAMDPAAMDPAAAGSVGSGDSISTVAPTLTLASAARATAAVLAATAAAFLAR
jgi:hypothetical protein